MRRLMTVVLVLGSVLCWATAALAAPFEGWTVEQIKAHPDFEAMDAGIYYTASPSRARENAEQDAAWCYEWIGVIWSEDESGRPIGYFFDSNGSHVTVDVPRYFDDPMPLWVTPAMDYLSDCGFIPKGCVLEDFSWAEVEKGFDPRARLKDLL